MNYKLFEIRTKPQKRATAHICHSSVSLKEALINKARCEVSTNKSDKQIVS